MKIGDIAFSRKGSVWCVLTMPNDSGWLTVKRIPDGLIFEIHVSDIIAF